MCVKHNMGWPVWHFVGIVLANLKAWWRMVGAEAQRFRGLFLRGSRRQNRRKEGTLEKEGSLLKKVGHFSCRAVFNWSMPGKPPQAAEGWVFPCAAAHNKSLMPFASLTRTPGATRQLAHAFGIIAQACRCAPAAA